MRMLFEEGVLSTAFAKFETQKTESETISVARVSRRNMVDLFESWKRKEPKDIFLFSIFNTLA
jgi:hypothetical protein